MHVVFEDREEAGRALAKRLSDYHSSDACVLAIPRGGIPVAAVVAHRLQLEWGVIVTRKLPIPWNPEAGFGSVAADGSTVLNDAMLEGLQLSPQQIEEIADQVRAEVVRRSNLYNSIRPQCDVHGKTVIVVDDGLASGYTMLAAIKSLRAKDAAKIVAAAPVASRSASHLVCEAADDCVIHTVSPAVPFAVANFYLNWHDLSDEDVIPLLESPHRKTRST